MIPILTADEIRALDVYTIQTAGVPGPVLMENAGRAVFEALMARYGDEARSGPTAVLCGRGNNGGDGFVVARYLLNRGCAATAYLLGRREEVKGDAAVHLGAYVGSGGNLVQVTGSDEAREAVAAGEAAVVVDAVLGTGLKDDVQGLAAAAIDWMKQARRPVVSVDIPSGVSSDSGRICGDAVQADLTVTFAYPKRGHYLYPGAALVGRLEVAEIGIPTAALGRIQPGVYCLEEEDFRGLLRRAADSHKGTFGHVFVLGGGVGKTGAPGLAARAALRSGAGLATVSWPAGLKGESRLPLEVMTEPLSGGEPNAAGWEAETWEAAAPRLSGASALVVGPGMGTSVGAGRFLERMFSTPGAPAVLDADALNLVAEQPSLWSGRKRSAVLTPHPGEAGRLLGSSVREVQSDRVGAVSELARRFGCAVVLKGAGTLVSEPGSGVFLIPRGNPGMATAGSGDVLSGVIGALLARGLSTLEAVRLGAYVHAVAGDLAAERLGVEGVIASDIVESLPHAFRRISS